MANSDIKNCLSDTYVTKAKRLAKLHQTSLKLMKQDNAMKDRDKESEEIKSLYMLCGKCRGETEQSDMAHMEDLCPVDKKRVSELIERLSESNKMQHHLEEQLALLDAENKALENRYQLFCNQNENEKSRLQSQLAHTVAELNKLRLQTSQSLDLLTRQIKAQERQFSQLTIMAKSLVQEKTQLEKTVAETNMKLRDTEAKLERVKENAEMERLMLLKDYMQKLNIKTEDQVCQTQESPRQTRNASPESKGIERNAKSPKTKDDLEELTTDGKLIQDLFFKRPNIPENESSGISFLSLFCSK